jgi:hypothetical protein
MLILNHEDLKDLEETDFDAIITIAIEPQWGIELPLPASLSPAMPRKGINSSCFLNRKSGRSSLPFLITHGFSADLVEAFILKQGALPVSIIEWLASK